MIVRIEILAIPFSHLEINTHFLRPIWGQNLGLQVFKKISPTDYIKFGKENNFTEAETGRLVIPIRF